MPYASVAAAHKAAPGLFSIGGHKLNTMGAINALARMYDAIKAAGSAKVPAAAAKAAFARSWSWDGSKWVRKTTSKELIVTTELKVPFAADLTLVKAVQEDGKRFLVYACADDGPDLQKGRDKRTGKRTVADVIDKAFLDKMARQNVEKSVPLVSTHEDPFEKDAPIGRAVDSWVAAPGDEVLGKTVAHHTLFTKFELADDPRADALWKRAEAGNDDRGVSVHGDLTKVDVEYHDALHGWVRRLADGDLDHHAVLKPGRAANPRAGLVAALSKALDESGVDVDVTDAMAKAEVDIESGPYGLRGYVRTDDDSYKYTGAYGFADALAAAKLRVEMPRLNDLLKSTLDNIMSAEPDDVPNKRAAMKASIDQYSDAVDALVADGWMSKAQADELDAEAAALMKSLEDETDQSTDDTGATVPENGGEAADQEESTMGDEMLEKALDPKAVAASLKSLREFTNTAMKLMGAEDGDLVPDADGDEPEAVEKALQELEAGAARGELLYKGFANQPLLDGGTAGALDAKMRERAQQTSPNPPPDQPTPGSRSNPGAMSKEQLEETVLGVMKSLGVELPDPQAQENADMVKAIEGIVKQALGKVTDEEVSKALTEPKGLQDPAGESAPLAPEDIPAAMAARIAAANEASGGEQKARPYRVSALVND